MFSILKSACGCFHSVDEAEAPKVEGERFVLCSTLRSNASFLRTVIACLDHVAQARYVND
jgi:hypothetical protein